MEKLVAVCDENDASPQEATEAAIMLYVGSVKQSGATMEKALAAVEAIWDLFDECICMVNADGEIFRCKK